MDYLAEDLSLSMVEPTCVLRVTRWSSGQVHRNVTSLVRSPAAVIGHHLRRQIPVGSETVALRPGDRLFVFLILEEVAEGRTLTEAEIEAIRGRWLQIEVQ